MDFTQFIVTNISGAMIKYYDYSTHVLLENFIIMYLANTLTCELMTITVATRMNQIYLLIVIGNHYPYNHKVIVS